MKIEMTVLKGEKRQVAPYETNEYMVSAKFEIEDNGDLIESAAMKAFQRIQETINEKQKADGINPRSPIVSTTEKVLIDKKDE